MITGQIRVVIVDDHPVTRTGLATLIAREPDMLVEGEAINGTEACSVIERIKPDVVLLDLGLPDISGVEVVRAMREKFPGMKFLVLSVFDGSEDIYSSLEAGAMGYLLKDCKPTELLTAVRTVHTGKQYLQTSVAHRLGERISIQDLTSREVKVLELVMMGKGNKEIANELSITERTVKTHIANIFEKLHVTSRSHAIYEGLRRGIIHLKQV